MANDTEKTIEEQMHDALVLRMAEKKKEIKERKAAEIKAGFLNPLGEGTSYDEFMEQVGKKTIAEYCKDKLEKETIEWIESEINLLKK